MSARLALSIAGVALALAGCGTIDAIRTAIASFIQPNPVRSRVEALRVVAEAGANRNSATALDIVFLYDTKAIDQLPRTGPEWFARKAELVALLASAVDVVSLQVPPATAVDVVPREAAPRAGAQLPLRYAGAVRVVAFPAYFDKDGQAAGNLTLFRRPVVTLKPDSVAYADG